MEIPKDYKNLDHLKELLSSLIQDLEEVVETLDKEPNSFNEKLILKYIEARRISDVVEFTKSKNRKTPSGTVYQSSDISSLIKEGASDIRPALLKMAQTVLENNKSSSSWPRS